MIISIPYIYLSFTVVLIPSKQFDLHLDALYQHRFMYLRGYHICTDSSGSRRERLTDHGLMSLKTHLTDAVYRIILDVTVCFAFALILTLLDNLHLSWEVPSHF